MLEFSKIGKFVSLIIIFSVGVPHAHAVTLSEAIKAGLLNHPSLLSAYENYQARLADIDVERAGYFPTVDISAGAGKEHTESPSTRASGEGGKTLSAAESELSIVQPIFDGFDTDSRVEQARSSALSAKERLSSQRLEIANDITNAYIDVLRATRLITVAEKDISKHDEILYRMKKRVEDGGGLPVNVDEAREGLALARSTLASAEERLFGAKARFSSLTGLAAEDFSPVFRLEDIPATLGKAIEIAADKNPSVMEARHAVQAAEYAVDIAKSAFAPTVDLEASASQNVNQGGISGRDRDGRILVRLRYNLFNGGADTAALKSRRLELNRARADLDRVLLELRRDIELSYITLAERRKRLASELERQIFNVKVVEGYEQQFLFGARTLLDLLSGYGKLYSNENSIIQAEYDILSQEFNILRFVGIPWYPDDSRLIDGAGSSAPPEGRQ